MSEKLKSSFLRENDDLQAKYEMLRAHFVEGVPVKDAAKQFGYSVPRFWQLWAIFKKEGIQGLFSQKKGPKDNWKVTSDMKEEIIRNRKAGMNVKESEEAFKKNGVEISHNTIWKILKKEGFSKKPRGKNSGTELVCKTHAKADIEALEGRSIQTKFAGLFFLIPYMRLLGIENWANEGPASTSDYPTLKIALTILNLKCIGTKRFSHVSDYSDDLGVAIATGMDRLVSKTTVHDWASNYSWDHLNSILKGTARRLIDLDNLTGELVNVDYHNIPYWGEAEPLAKEYIPTRGKGIRAIKTIMVQDQNSTFPFWSTTRRADLSADRALLIVADVCDEIFGKKERKIVFDCTSTTYRTLDKLNERGVQFLTLRRMCDSLRKAIATAPKADWFTVHMDIPKRIHQKLRYWESTISLKDYKGTLRQIVVKDNGHEEPMVVLTNDTKSPIKQCLEDYARRWRVENNISENIDFFSLNRLSGFLELKADVNVTFALIADQLFKLFAKDIAGYEQSKPETLFRKFIHKSGTVEVTKDEVIVTLNPFNEQDLLAPVFRNIEKVLAQNNLALNVPWLGARKLVLRFS